MLKEIRDQLIIDIRAGVSLPGSDELYVDKYRGEFAEGSDWNPRQTACFLQVTGKIPVVKASTSETLKYKMMIRIYAGAKSKVDIDALDVAEAVMDLLSGQRLTVGDNSYVMSDSLDGMDLILYEKGFEAYAFNLIIS